MCHPDFVIAGAGIIGLSLALELDRRGASVVVLEAGDALAQTSFAAAGMLAAEDPANPPALHALASLSAGLYPGFLDRIAELSGVHIPFQTLSTLESLAPHFGSAAPWIPAARSLVPQLAASAPDFRLLDERSIDPRQLAPALLAAVRFTGVELREHTALKRIAVQGESVRMETSGEPVTAPYLVDCMGTWSPAPVAPRKGQMLAVSMPSGFDLTAVVRTPEVYIVPRTQGPHAGRAIIGATIEDAGFDLTVHGDDILALNARAIRLLPALAQAEFLDSWAGLRPSTVDGLPILGTTARQPRYVLATGHFRNGILLAPATARVLAQLLTGETPSVELAPFAPTRFG